MATEKFRNQQVTGSNPAVGSIAPSTSTEERRQVRHSPVFDAFGIERRGGVTDM
jgi:hypothetical protein